MKKHFITRLFQVLFITVILTACNDSESVHSNEFRMPAEFESQHALWLSSPTVDYKTGWSMMATQAQMIKELIPTIHIYYAINDDTDRVSLINELLAAGVAQGDIDDHVSFYTVPHGDLWIRDTGGTFMKNEKGEMKVIDFDFDAYRMEPYINEATNAIYQFDNDLSLRIAEALNLPVERSPLIAEGGNFHFNGKGTVIVNQKALTISNPGWTLGEIENEIKRVFNVKSVIFINEPSGVDLHAVLDGPLYFENETYYNAGVYHIDESVSWVNENTVLLLGPSEHDIESGNPFVLKEKKFFDSAYETLSKAKDQDGNPINIITQPIAAAPISVELIANDVTYNFLKNMTGIRDFPENDEPINFVLAASYINYVITPEVILVPKLYKPGRNNNLATTDAAFKHLMQELFPERRVVQIDVDALTVGGGGMHCITQQVPGMH